MFQRYKKVFYEFLIFNNLSTEIYSNSFLNFMSNHSHTQSALQSNRKWKSLNKIGTNYDKHANSIPPQQNAGERKCLSRIVRGSAIAYIIPAFTVRDVQ